MTRPVLVRPQRAIPEGGLLPCQRSPELFFAELPRDLEQAKALCQCCLVRAACLAGALQRGEPCGVWGGELLLNGRVITQKRPRGRPPRASLAHLDSAGRRCPGGHR